MMLKAFYTVMLWLSQFEEAIAEATSSNFNYIMHCRERVRYWTRERRLWELNK